MNWFTIFGLLIQLGEDAMAAQVEISQDQEVTSPPLYPTLEGHKFALVLVLAPVPGTPKGQKPTGSYSWYQILGLILTEGSQLLADAQQIAADQPFSTPQVPITLEGFPYTACIKGTPA